MMKKNKAAKKIIAVRFKGIHTAEGVQHLREHLQQEFGGDYRIAMLPSCVESFELVDTLELRQGRDV